MKHSHVISLSGASLSIGLAFLAHVFILGLPGFADASAPTIVTKPSTAKAPATKAPAKPAAPNPLPKAADKAPFTVDQKTGTKHPEVLALQRYLNQNGYIIVKDGPGSPGHETDLFGAGTRTALTKLQKDKKITGENGIVGPKTRQYLNKVAAPAAAATPKPEVALPPLTTTDPLLEIARPVKPAIVEISMPASIAVGKKFDVFVTLKDAKNLDTVRLNGSFDPKLLRLDSMAHMSFDAESPGNFINNASGTFSFGEFSTSKRISGNLRIAALTFMAKKGGKARIDLVDGSDLYIGGEGVDRTLKGASMVIGGKK